MTPASAQPDRILKDLAKLWADLGKEEAAPEYAGVLRACAMTLIVTVGGDEDAQAMGETLAELMREHPSRVIVVRAERESDAKLEARVSAQCWKPFGRPQQICCEQIEIAASPSRLTDLPKLVLGLMVPDLPVVLWSRSPDLGDNAGFRQLFGLSEKIIADSSQYPDPEAGLNYVKRLLDSGRNVADLEWTRLTPLREAVAQVFEREESRPFIAKISQAEILHEGENAPVSARYLANWFTRTLPAPLQLTFRSAAAQETVSAPHGESRSYPIREVSLKGAGFAAAIRIEGSCAILTANGMDARTAFPALNDFLLLTEELSILGIDSVFRRCVE